MRLALAAASVTAVTGLALLAVPAAQANDAPPRVELRTTLTGPLFEGIDLGASETMYELKVANDAAGATATATGVVLKTTVYECPRGDLVYLHCTKYQVDTRHLGPIAPGKQYSDMFILNLPNNQKEVWFRVVSDVVRVDQLNLGPAPGACIDSLYGSPTCAATTLDLLP